MTKCLICEKEYKLERSLKYHIIKTHKISWKQYCKIFNIIIQKSYCKTCGKEINYNKQYCNKTCASLDKELNKKRIRKIKNDIKKQSVCSICGKIFNDTVNASGILSKHLREAHQINTKKVYNYYTIQDKPTKDIFRCPYCNWTSNDLKNNSGWFTRHLYKIHNLSPEQHIENFPEHKNLWKIYFEQKDREKFLNTHIDNRIECRICGKMMKKISNSHLKKHNLTLTEYKLKYDSNTISSNTSKKISQNTINFNLNHGSAFKNKISNLEQKFIHLFTELKIEFQYQYLFEGKRFDFFIPEQNIILEVDGDAFHRSQLENLTLQSINTCINDFQKIQILNQNLNFKFIKILESNCFFGNDEIDTKEHFFESLEKKKYLPIFELKYYKTILNKDYLIKYKQQKGSDKLQKYIPLLLKFIRTFQPELPRLPIKENLQWVIEKINRYDVSNICDKNNIFNNNCSTIGTNYLKSTFNSFWNSKFNKNKSPIEAWNDDKIMYDVIKYRIGLNNSNEVFDFSLANLIKGISARRITISFFKPILASAIYDKIIDNNKKDSILLDPCCGFGGRLLSFKSKYPFGTYVGCEPNIKTYNELLKLIDNANFSNCFIYNCKFEDFDISKIHYDVAFTSIPYYDLEIYNDSFNYESLEDWKNKFVSKILQLNNAYIVLPKKIYDELLLTNKIWGKIESNKSHFSKENKFELIIKI